jgi:hypothetical protein
MKIAYLTAALIFTANGAALGHESNYKAMSFTGGGNAAYFVYDANMPPAYYSSQTQYPAVAVSYSLGLGGGRINYIPHRFTGGHVNWLISDWTYPFELDIGKPVRSPWEARAFYFQFSEWNGTHFVGSSKKSTKIISPSTTLGEAVDGEQIQEIDFGGVTVPEPQIGSFTAAEIFSNPDTFKHPKLEYGNTRIVAEFTPHISIGGISMPVDLQDAALLFGVDHFNWKQSVVDPGLPLGWKVERVSRESGNYLGPQTQPRLDPIESSVELYKLTNGTGITHTLRYYDRDTDIEVIPDNLPYYYDDSDVPRVGIALTFADKPSYPHDFNPHGAYRQFETELVGVMEDGTESNVRTGIKFRWKSNTVTDPLSGRIFVDGDSSPGPIVGVVGGGIFDVEVLRSVPEPTTTAMITTLTLVWLGVRRRRCQPD